MNDPKKLKKGIGANSSPATPYADIIHEKLADQTPDIVGDDEKHHLELLAQVIAKEARNSKPKDTSAPLVESLLYHMTMPQDVTGGKEAA